ncbi:MAG TPA: hypothetical protein ENJ55_01925 [Rhizobiales bacterium]|nr:hypothetical protein [Hyphomicrobiales bacterium]
MKKLLLTSTILIAAFATPALAESCTDMMAKFDTAIETAKIADEAKMKALEMREQGAKQQSAGDEAACVATLAAALQELNG